jgi:hypothetical protein
VAIQFLHLEGAINRGHGTLRFIEFAEGTATWTCRSPWRLSGRLSHLPPLDLARQLPTQLMRPRLDDRVVRDADDRAIIARQRDLDLRRLTQQPLQLFSQRHPSIVHDRSPEFMSKAFTPPSHSPQLNPKRLNSPIDVFPYPRLRAKADVHPRGVLSFSA